MKYWLIAALNVVIIYLLAAVGYGLYRSQMALVVREQPGSDTVLVEQVHPFRRGFLVVEMATQLGYQLVGRSELLETRQYRQLRIPITEAQTGDIPQGHTVRVRLYLSGETGVFEGTQSLPIMTDWLGRRVERIVKLR